MTIVELGDLRDFRVCLKKIAKIVNVPFDVFRKNVDMKLCPHWIVNKRLSDNPAPSPRVKGSDMHDRHLVAIGSYSDAIFVDKRTMDSFNRAKLKNEGITGFVVKSSDYHKIPGILSNL